MERDDEYSRWLREFRSVYERRLRREERFEKIGSVFAFAFRWFFLAFWSLGLYFALFDDDGLGRGVIAAAVCGAVVAGVSWPVMRHVLGAGPPE